MKITQPQWYKESDDSYYYWIAVNKRSLILICVSQNETGKWAIDDFIGHLDVFAGETYDTVDKAKEVAEKYVRELGNILSKKSMWRNQ